eukprot:scaffold45833_cov23-Tisochrysis_lutea.AAC.2
MQDASGVMDDGDGRNNVCDDAIVLLKILVVHSSGSNLNVYIVLSEGHVAPSTIVGARVLILHIQSGLLT